MRHLWIEIEVVDFDLETIGFFFNILNPDTKESRSNSFLRMSLVELGVFINALKASATNISLAASNGNTSKSRADQSPGLSGDRPLPSQGLMKPKISAEMPYKRNGPQKWNQDSDGDPPQIVGPV